MTLHTVSPPVLDLLPLPFPCSTSLPHHHLNQTTQVFSELMKQCGGVIKGRDELSKLMEELKV